MVQGFSHLKIVRKGKKVLKCYGSAICEERHLPSLADEGNIAIQSRLARLLIRSLTENCAGYCILTGYEGLPDKVNSDIDFAVNASDFKRVPALLDEIAALTGTSLFQVIPHEVTGRAFLIAAHDSGTLRLIQPDSCTDYCHFGKLWLYADEIVGSRRWHERGFWIPGASSEFIYYLIKRINKRDITLAHQSKLSRLYAENPSECNRWLHRFWGRHSADTLAEMAEMSDWHAFVNGLDAYRSELMRHSRKSFTFGARASHMLDRILKPTGGWLAFIGPDGCGKSSVIEAIEADFAPAFQKVVCRHLRPKALPAKRADGLPVTDPHGQPVRGNLYSVAKILYLFLDYWIGYLRRVRSEMVRTKLVTFDRYFYDILVDPRRVLYGGPRWLPRMLSHLIPRPELVFLLDAPVDVLWSRKQEVQYDEVVRQQREYLELARRIPGAIVIDASKSLQEVTFQVEREIIDHFSRRTRHRMKLGS